MLSKLSHQSGGAASVMKLGQRQFVVCFEGYTVSAVAVSDAVILS